ncbi:MAG: ATP-binding protein [Chloroflexota bacterium]
MSVSPRSAANPFRYGEVVASDTFADRASEIAELLGHFNSGQNVVLISPRRFGKTSLILKAAELARRDGALVAYLDLFRAPTPERLAHVMAQAIHEGLVAPIERVWQRAVAVFDHLPLRPRITVSSDGIPTLELSVAERQRDVDQTIEQLLQIPQRVAEQRKRPVVFIIDELQEIVTIDPGLPRVLRSAVQMQPDVAHVFLGSRRHLMQSLFTDENQPLYRSARPFPLGPIPRDQFAGFIRERFQATGRSLSEDALTSVLDITEGHPHDTQELCSFVWALASPRTSITPAHVTVAAERVIEAEHARLSELWSGLSAAQRALLAAIAQDGRAVYSEQFRRTHRLGAASTVQRSVSRLTQLDLVERTQDDRLRIADTFLRLWVRRAILGVPLRPEGA